jgi:hypothetical protein
MHTHAPRLLAFLLAALGAQALAQPADTTAPHHPAAALPPAREVLAAPRAYPAVAVASTRHRGWAEGRGYANFPQTVKVRWHVDPGSEVELTRRPAWDAGSTWRLAARWRGRRGEPERGVVSLELDEPTLLRLRSRAGKFPRKGRATLRVEFRRHTVAVLHGNGGTRAPAVLMAEGYDPFNEQDWNDPENPPDPALPRLVTDAVGRERAAFWLLDWGDGGAALEQQAEDFTSIVRQLRSRAGGASGVVVVGVSMGAVSTRLALAQAADRREDLGVLKYLSLNGPHRGAWVSPRLVRYLLRRAGAAPANGEGEKGGSSDAGPEQLIRRGLDNPAARSLLIGAPGHDPFFAALRSHGRDGYDPSIPRVAFSNGSLVREGNDLAELVLGERQVIHRIRVRPLFLPVWLPLHRTYRRFRYDGYPGELLPASMMEPRREHLRFMGIFRFDIRADWTGTPTFIPTHSALDFPEELSGGPERFRYTRWRESAFPKVYVSAGRNRPHDETAVTWIDPRTGKGAAGEDAVLHEIATAFAAARR